MPTNIVNLYSGPGGGKSTTAAHLYYLMKAANINAELVREYVKEWAWEQRAISTYDQLYFLGKQIRRETLLFNRADWLITDSPVLLGTFYANKYSPKIVAHGVETAIDAYYEQCNADGHRHLHILLNRSKPYMSIGRYQNEEEAKQFDTEIKQMLVDKNIRFFESGTNDNDAKLLMKKVLWLTK